jgi:NADH:ubiquinone oxidoreductase subunit 6 (subunit J)
MTNLPSRLADLWPILCPIILGGIAVYLLLPRARPIPALWGAIAAGLAILSGGWLLLRTNIFTPETLLFYAFSAIAVLGGGLLVTQRNPARAALSFAVVVLAVCGLFLLQAAPFLMVGTIIIYAGSIVVTFLFVLMLAQQEGPSDADQRSREPLLATIGGIVLLGAVLYLVRSTYQKPTRMDEFAEKVNAVSRRLDEVNERIAHGADPNSAESTVTLDDVRDLVGDTESEEAGRWESAVVGLANQQALQDFEHTVTNTRFAASLSRGTGGHARVENLLDLQDRLHKLAQISSDLRTSARQQAGLLQPIVRPGGHQSELSDFSGTPADRPADEVRRDDNGRPQMPADNLTMLGRSLFTDYLLAVELAGTLLLVATVGAIAIAMRRQH